MEPFATLTVSRGDRPQFLEFCKEQITNFTIQPKHSIFVTEPPTSEECDITVRMRKGIVAARNLGIDIVYVIEDDDAYDADYIEKNWIGGYEFIGASKTLYYNLKNSTHQVFDHPKRSSLFCTAFRISALDKFVWPSDDTIFLDLVLWQYAFREKKNVFLHEEPIGVGIKHAIGKTAGIGHRIVMKNKDTRREYLKSIVSPEAFRFYSNL